MPLKVQIRSLRQAKGMTLAELASKVGISAPHLSEIERGKKNLNNHLLLRLSEALEVEPAELIGGPSSEKFSEISEKMRQLSPGDRERVEAFVDALLTSKSE